MKELTLRELKDIELEILMDFKSFCEANQIKYYLGYGTLLGAIRYKGFIPWDDDVDVLVPRQDYNRIMEIYKDHDNLKLFSIERNARYGYPFAKLCDITTKKVEENLENGFNQGVEIDIFPIDYWNDDIEMAKSEVARLKQYHKRLTFAKLRPTKARNRYRFLALKCLTRYYRMIGTKHWIDKIINLSYRKMETESRYAGNKVWCPYGERDICPAEVFSDSIKIEFEGQEFPAPIGYDTYLTRLYGDYLPEPPKERQKTHHKFKAYRIGNVDYETE